MILQLKKFMRSWKVARVDITWFMIILYIAPIFAVKALNEMSTIGSAFIIEKCIVADVLRQLVINYLLQIAMVSDESYPLAQYFFS